MAGEVLDMAIEQTKEILTGEFSVELTITPTGEDAVTIRGLATRHSEGFDSTGLPIVTDNAHCSFFEKDLNDLNVVTRDSKGNVNIQDWKVSWTDAIGIVNYKFGEVYPDKTLGLIKIQLNVYE